MTLVLDLRITHERFGRSSDLSLNGNLRYPNDIDRSLNETVPDKIRKFLVDYNNNLPTGLSFIFGSTLTKDVSLRVHLNIDDTSITSRTHTHPSHS